MGLGRKRGRMEMVLIYFLSHLLSSVCSLSALITAVCKSHQSICGLFIPQKPSVWLNLLVTKFLAKTEGLRARIINLLHPFGCALLSPTVISNTNSFFIFFTNLTIDLLPKLHPLRAVLTVLWHSMEDIEEVMTWMNEVNCFILIHLYKKRLKSSPLFTVISAEFLNFCMWAFKLWHCISQEVRLTGGGKIKHKMNTVWHGR